MLLAALLASVEGSATIQSRPQPDVVVTDSRWGKVVSKIVITDRGTFSVPPETRLPRRRPGTPPPKIILQREAYVLVRNAGSKTVKSVTWAYVFYEDKDRQREMRRVQFQSKERVKPGEMKFLSASVDDDAPTPFGAAVITHVEYEGN